MLNSSHQHSKHLFKCYSYFLTHNHILFESYFIANRKGLVPHAGNIGSSVLYTKHLRVQENINI